MEKRYFTLAEANSLLPQVAGMILSLQELKREIDAKFLHLQEQKQRSPETPSDAFFAEEAELEFLMMNANGLLGQLAGLGADLKDIDSGLVDFLTLVDGQEALLCWHLGETEITHWHGLYEGYQGRKPIY